MKPRKRLLKNGKAVWDARWYGPDGKEKSHTCTTQKAAKDYAAEKEREIKYGTYSDPSHLKTPLRYLVQEHRDRATRPNTWSSRNTVYNALDKLGDAQIGMLRPSHIQTWANGLVRCGLKPSTVNTRLQVIRAALGHAVEEGLIAKNPARGVKVKKEPEEVLPDEVPTVGQVNDLLRIFRDGSTDEDEKVLLAPVPAMRLAVDIAANTGLRAGEVLGLRVRDVNEVAGTISVIEQQGGAELKTARSMRKVTLDAETMGSIVSTVEAWGLDSGEQIIRGRQGQPMAYRSLQSFLARARDLCAYPDEMAFHSLRHFHATMLLRAGVPIKLVSTRLGHTSVTQTLNTYAHFLPEDDELAAGVVSGLLRDSGGISPSGEGGLRVAK